MNKNRLLLILAVAAVIVSVVAAGFTYFSVSNLVSRISGFATSTGEANLTVESVVSINFTTAFVDWGSGRVNDGQSIAQLTTLELNNVTNGNWTLTTVGGLRIENIGNVNVTLNLTAGKTAAQFLGGTNPGYQWNITNLEANSCLNSSSGTGALAHNIFYDVNTTTADFCNIFQFADGSDTIRIDLNLSVPSDSLTGALTDTITATAEAI